MPQRRERRCSFNAASASFSITSRSQLPSAMQIALHDDAAVSLLDGDRNETLLEARTAHTPAGVRCVGRTVRRAYQMQTPDIKKLSGLPVQFHGHVRAAIEVGIDPPSVAHGERRLWPAAHIDFEAHPVAQVHQIYARANYPFLGSHRVNPSILSRQARIVAIRRASGRQGLQETRERLGQPSAKRNCFPGERMVEYQFGRVQEHALEPLLPELAVELEPSVFVVPCYREPQVGELDPNLMSTSGQELRRKQGVIAEKPLSSEYGLGFAAFSMHADPPLAGAGQIFLEWQADATPVLLPDALYERKVMFADLSFAKRRVQRSQRRALLGEDEQTGSFPVEAVRELQEFQLRPGGAKLLDDPEAHPASTMDCEPSGLVHDEERVVLEDDRRQRGRSRHQRSSTDRRAQRGNPDSVTRPQAIGRVHASAVHPDLTGAQDAVDMAARHALADAQQEVVHALAFASAVDLDCGGVA